MITVRALAPEDWPIVERLFGERGACGGCWCMWWHVERKLWKTVKGATNRASLKARIEAGGQHAMLAFEGGDPVGWCAFGPRASFPRLATVKAYRTAWDQGTWSVVCFYIPARCRKRGVASVLLAAATERAFALGAQRVEGYPAVPKKPGTMPAVFAWTGLPSMFESQGYRPIPPRVYIKERSEGRGLNHG